MFDISKEKTTLFRHLPFSLQSLWVKGMLKYYRRSLQCSYLITHKCPAHCKHCDFWISGCDSDHVDIIALEKNLRSIRKQKFRSINLTGGDPLAHPDFFSIVNLCRNIGFENISVNTTGLLLEDEKLKQYKNSDIDHTVLSLDGEKTVHDWFRGTKGAHDKVIHVLKALNGQQTLQLSFVIIDANFDQIPYVAEIARQYGCKLTCQPFDLTLENSSQNKHLILNDPIKINSVERTLISLKKNSKYCHVISPSMSHINRIIQYLRNPSDVQNPCVVGYWRTHVEPNGDIFPCYPFSKVGNLGESDFDHIWNGSKYADIRKKMIARSCPNCLLNCYTTVNERLYKRLI